MSLTELMVVMAIIAILAGLILMSVSRTKNSARQTVCINNEKQLITTWAQWANDNNGRLVPSHPWYDNGERMVPWVTGMGHPNYGAMTNSLYLLDDNFASFAPYLNRARVYKCPESKEKIMGFDTIRSYSMNQFMGTPRKDNTWWYFEEKDDIPEPSRFFVFADQNPKYICWPIMMIRMTNNYWINLPATHHNYGGTLSFGDGHVEYHKWREKPTKGHPSVQRWVHAAWPNHGTQAQPNDRDLAWLRYRSTMPKGTNGIAF